MMLLYPSTPLASERMDQHLPVSRNFVPGMRIYPPLPRALAPKSVGKLDLPIDLPDPWFPVGSGPPPPGGRPVGGASPDPRGPHREAQGGSGARSPPGPNDTLKSWIDEGKWDGLKANGNKLIKITE